MWSLSKGDRSTKHRSPVRTVPKPTSGEDAGMRRSGEAERRGNIDDGVLHAGHAAVATDDFQVKPNCQPSKRSIWSDIMTGRPFRSRFRSPGIARGALAARPGSGAGDRRHLERPIAGARRIDSGYGDHHGPGLPIRGKGHGWTARSTGSNQQDRSGVEERFETRSVVRRPGPRLRLSQCLRT